MLKNLRTGRATCVKLLRSQRCGGLVGSVIYCINNVNKKRSRWAVKRLSCTDFSEKDVKELMQRQLKLKKNRLLLSLNIFQIAKFHAHS